MLRLRRCVRPALLAALMGVLAAPVRASRVYPIQFVHGPQAVVYLNQEGELAPGDTLYVVRQGERVGEGVVSTVNGLQANVDLRALSVTLAPSQDMLVATGVYARLREKAAPSLPPPWSRCPTM